jgi:hypothetical protein
MRARLAYISSLGTTTILVAAAVLLLGVVGAIVAFDGWPGGETGATVQTVPLARPAAVTAARRVVRAGTARRPVRAKPAASATRRRASTAGLVKQVETDPRVVPGLVMVPAPVGPIASPPPVHPPAVGTDQVGPHSPAAQDIAPPNGGPAIPSDPIGTLPVAVPVPLPDPTQTPLPGGTQPPAPEQIAAMVGELLGGVPPPPVVPGVPLSR